MVGCEGFGRRLVGGSVLMGVPDEDRIGGRRSAVEVIVLAFSFSEDLYTA
jgi:hypothetical protein